MAFELRRLFQAQVEDLWETARHEDSLLNLAACNTLINAYVWDSQDEKGLDMVQNAFDMAARLDMDLRKPGAMRRYRDLSASDARMFAFAAWGTFCNMT